MKIIYNNYYGGFNFSPEFVAAYKQRTGRSLGNITTLLYHTGPTSIRCDPDAIALIEEHGSSWASGDCSELAIREIPDVFANYWEIDEYDGNETVRVNTAQAFADVLDTYMETRDHSALERQYAVLVAAREELGETSPFGLHASDLTPTSSAAPPQLTVSDDDD